MTRPYDSFDMNRPLHPAIRQPARPRRQTGAPTLRRWLPQVLTLALAAGVIGVAAQTAAPASVDTTGAPRATVPASPAASDARVDPNRPLLPKAPPRVGSPSQSSAQTVSPGELRPENPVTPQIAVPVLGGASGPPTVTTQRPVPPGVVLPRGGVDDAVARCNAEQNAVERARCRDELAVRGQRAPG